MKRLVIFILLLPIFVYSFFATSWVGSYMMIDEDWQEHRVFTSELSTDPQEILEIDKYIFAFKHEPIVSVICILTFFMLLGILTSLLMKKLRISKTL
ncbi:DUF4306 domain-containing protein [Metabacillus niabensis]|uniref:DUF4306 domain-containing protein n=1 Tax=Metabacillus niabensis TaxID=324854 RepID=A0ABT9Z1C6_9BACI|nr:DUF4306 domain-containing protein [Metabacillus niabensis]MDQ0226058.1 hypothetical protein [Metabacillus niabensis]PAD69174.1 hypothetical protein CHH83_10095 [Bacillus sp. 7586-K]